ncbi:MAG: pyridoxamine 5'-phosphate oxidase family protein, partial [Dehalococcoidia bacterium]
MPEPTSGRPRQMKDYGVPDDAARILPWSWAQERLEGSRNYWVSTVAADGAPHSAPVWGVWVDDVFYFDTGATTKKARNIEADARVTVTTEHADEAVIVHGRAEAVPPSVMTDRFDEVYAAKYGSSPPGQRYVVRPSHAFGFIEEASQFAATATR